MPLVSVIIPNYNTKHLLCDAIDSVLTSSFLDYEIVVIDDGGVEDATDLMLDRYKGNERIKFKRQANTGLAGARNTGIEISEGDFLVFLDSDDVITSEKLGKQADFLKNNPQCGVVYSLSCWFKGEDQEDAFSTEFPVYEGLILQHLLFGNFIHVNSAMVRKSVVVNSGLFNSKYRELEDWDLWIRLSISGVEFRCIPEVLSKVRLRIGSMTNDQYKMNNAMVRVLVNLEECFKESPLKKQYYHALHLFKIQAKDFSHFDRSLMSAWSACGYSFTFIAIWLYLKKTYRRMFFLQNESTKKIEAYWRSEK